MTKSIERSYARPIFFAHLPLILFLSLSAFVIIFSSIVTDAVSYGIKLSVLRVIPSLFPFFILSDYFATSVSFSGKGVLSRLFYRTLGISPPGLKAFVIGALGGFPLGVKCAVEEYRQGVISKDELEGLIGAVNNPSPAFVIVSVGTLMLGDTGVGVILYTSVLLSAIAVGWIFKAKHKKIANSNVISRQRFDFAASIKSAGYSSLVVSSYIIFFSAVIGAISAVIKNEVLLAILSSLFEIGNAASRLASANIPSALRLSAIGFALGFSGLSVHMQAFSLLGSDIRKQRYLIMKLVQGCLSALLAFVIFSVL